MRVRSTGVCALAFVLSADLMPRSHSPFLHIQLPLASIMYSGLVDSPARNDPNKYRSASSLPFATANVPFFFCGSHVADCGGMMLKVAAQCAFSGSIPVTSEARM